jgi:opacity protein-like surface antigen
LAPLISSSLLRLQKGYSKNFNYHYFRMKKTARLLFAAILSGIFAISATAQPYLALKGGYAIGTVSTVLDRNIQTGFPTTAITRSLQNVYGTYGTGSNFGLDVGYMFSEHFGFNLNGSYFMGNKVDGGTYSFKNDSLQRTISVVTTTTQLRITPSFIASAGNHLGFNPYARLGVILPILNYSDETIKNNTKVTKVETNSGLTTTFTNIQLTNRVSYKYDIGFAGALGTTYAINENLAIMAEIELNAFSAKTEKASATAYSYDYKREPTIGNPATKTGDISNADAYTRETIYSDYIDQNSNSGYSEISLNKVIDRTKPQEILAKINSTTAIGINIGIRYNLQTAAR